MVKTRIAERAIVHEQTFYRIPVSEERTSG